MLYPTIKEVEEADHIQICRWYRFLASPSDLEQVEVMNLIVSKWREGGGFTSEISKMTGWDEREV